jgi:ABC-type sugar transport system substrate-binding protein
LPRISRAGAIAYSVAVAAAIAVGGCGSSDDGSSSAAAGSGSSGAKTVCFLFQDVETEFWAAGIKLITTSIRDKGWEVKELNSQADANRQLEQIRDCISQKVDGIIIIPHDGESVVNMIALANRENIPIGVFNRPPADSNQNKNIQVVADNAAIAQETVAYLAEQAKEVQSKTGKKVKPLIMVGDLGDVNAVNRKAGFDAVIKANPDVFEKPVEVATKWDAETGRAGLESAMQANPDVGMIFSSSDFLFPQIRSVLEPLGKWKPRGESGHVILGGLDGDSNACKQLKDGYVDATGVQNLQFEASEIVKSVEAAIEKGEGQPDQDIADKGFALTAGNLKEREKDMWGCVIAPPK